ncbi:MAG: multidrug effflux MFS transporter [Neisseria sp.]|nr:multidrug effflux MFS transporter [Neisseria sp.]
MSISLPLSEKQMAILLALMVAILPLSIDAYLPALPDLARDLQADIHHIEKSLSMFMFGVALGQLTGGSWSDIKGRRVVALGGLAVYAVSTLAIVLAQTADQLLLLRFVQAVGGGMAVVMSGAVVRDFFTGRQAAQMFALIGIVMMAAPLLAPMIGSVLQIIGGWRLIFGFLMAYAVLVFALLWKFLPNSGGGGQFDRYFVINILRRYQQVLRTKIALGFLFFQAFSFGCLFVFVTESPFVYMNLYGLSSSAYAWAFGCNIVTMGTFNRITAWRLKRGSNAEDILLWGLGIQLLANVLLVLLVLSSADLPPFAAVVACVMFAVGTQGLITANTQACFMSHFKEAGGTANAVLMASTSIIGAFMGWLATELHNGTIYIMPSLMLASTLTGVILLFALSRQTWRNKKM